MRTVWVYAFGLASTVYNALRVVLCPFVSRCDQRRICDEVPRTWSRSILWATGVEVEVEGAEVIDPARPQLVVSNHQSWFDVFALAAHFPGRYHFVAKQELAAIPIFGRAWLTCGHIAIDRHDRSSAIESLERAGEKIRKETATIIMFPEGTRSPTGELQRFKKGAFVLALKAGVPVVPVAVVGSREIMPKGRWRVRPGRIRIRFGEPIPGDEYAMEERDDLLQRTWAAVAALKEGKPTEEVAERAPPPAPPGHPRERETTAGEPPADRDASSAGATEDESRERSEPRRRS